MNKFIITYLAQNTFARHCFQPFVIALVVALFPFPATAQEFTDLPDIGDPTAAVLPLSKEQRLGEVFARGLRAKLPLVEDIELNEYVSAIGNQLTNAHPNIQMKFHFLLIRNPTINAFATIGGVIALNSGLLLVTQNESQFASVIAHEIGHVTQRHIARMLAQHQNFSWANALALLSVIIAATYNSDIGQLGLYTSAALPIDQQLAYSRAHEIESDRVGIRLMQAAGIDPIGMSDFFSLLQSYKGPVSIVPEILRTHPLTVDRINNALNFTKSSRKQYRKDSPEFQFARARLSALLNPQTALRSAGDDPVASYQRGVALSLLQRPQESAYKLRQIPNGENSLPIQLGLAQAEILQGNYAAAVKILRRLAALYPRRETVSYYLALALLRQNELSLAFDILQPFIVSNRHALTKKLLAEITARQKRYGISYEYLSDYYATNGHVHIALQHLKKAMSFDSRGHVFLARIKTKRKQLEQLKKELTNPLP